MAEDYVYDPRSVNPVLAGLAAGSVGAIAAALLASPLDSPSETAANPISITVLALAIGALSGLLWRSVRAQNSGTKIFAWTIGGGLLVVLSSLAVIEWLSGGGWFQYAGLVVGVIFLSVGLLTPVISRAVGPPWAALLPVVLAVVVAVGLSIG